jgi:hypothetical protein
VQTRKVKRIYPMQQALMILLRHERHKPAEARKASLSKAVLVHRLTRPDPVRF